MSDKPRIYAVVLTQTGDRLHVKLLETEDTPEERERAARLLRWAADLLTQDDKQGN